MPPRVGRRNPRSLIGGYGCSPGRCLRRRVAAVRIAFWRLLVAVSPLHYDRGDMRRAYRLTWAVVDLLALLMAFVVGRLALTGVFVSVVTAHPPLVAAFNLGVSVLAVSAIAAIAGCRARLARRRRIAAARLDRL